MGGLGYGWAVDGWVVYRISVSNKWVGDRSVECLFMGGLWFGIWVSDGGRVISWWVEGLSGV